MSVLDSVRIEHRRYKKLVDDALPQVTDAQLLLRGSGGTNSIAIMCWHTASNVISRFTDFLTTDGEKPWRDREDEFAERKISREELIAKWEEGWKVFFDTLDRLSDDDLERTVTVRGKPMPIHEALLRSLTHTSYHTGQIVQLARSMCGNAWQFLSIPPGESMPFNPGATTAV